MATYLTSDSAPATTIGVDADGYVFTAGTALDPATGARSTSAATITDEVEQCFQVIDSALAKAGASRTDLVKTTCWLSDETFRSEFITAYKSHVAPEALPTRVTMVASLPAGCRVAIEAVAHKAA